MSETVKQMRPKWRVFEDIAHGWWGIESDGDDDGEPILYPIKISREALDRIVNAHNGVGEHQENDGLEECGNFSATDTGQRSTAALAKAGA